MKPVHIDMHEFGEIYHIAAYLAADPKHKAIVIGNDDFSGYCDFLNNVSQGSTTLENKRAPGRSIAPGHTADYFARERSNAVDRRVLERLRPLLSPPSKEAINAVKRYSGLQKSCLLWVRNGTYKPERNLTGIAFDQLLQVLGDCGYKPIIIGHKSHFVHEDEETNLVEYYKKPCFYRKPQAQLEFLSHLCDMADVRFSIGMKSGAMDGLAFARQLKTIYFGNLHRNDRMNKVGSAFGAFTFIPVTYRKKFVCFSKQELESIYADIDTSALMP